MRLMMTKIYNRKTEKEKRRILRNSMTLFERLLWDRLRKRQVRGKRFLRQYSIERYVIDFYCPEFKFAVEIDGEIHDLPEERENDKIRQVKLEGYGIRFMRFSNSQVTENINEIILRIEKKIDDMTDSRTYP